jgi:hypothetical protein
MTGPPTIARLHSEGRIWALGALLGDDAALKALARALLPRWQQGDRLVVLGNMLGPNGNPARTLDGLLVLRGDGPVMMGKEGVGGVGQRLSRLRQLARTQFAARTR